MGVGLILAKFGVAVAFGVGAAAIESSNGVGAGEGVDLAGMMTGVAVMLMAAFMPWVIWKAIPIVEAATATAGVERAPMRGAVVAGSLAVAATVGGAQLAGLGASQSAASAGATGSLRGRFERLRRRPGTVGTVGCSRRRRNPAGGSSGRGDSRAGSSRWPGVRRRRGSDFGRRTRRRGTVAIPASPGSSPSVETEAPSPLVRRADRSEP